MLQPAHIENAKRYLFATVDEMKANGLGERQVQRLLRVREAYTRWLSSPTLKEKDIVEALVKAHGVSTPIAYEDMRLVKVCLGNFAHLTTDYFRYRFLIYCEEAFDMAREKGDAKAFASVLSAFGKYSRLDQPEPQGPDYSQIVPEQFIISQNPEDSGFKAPPGILHRARALEKKLLAAEGDFSKAEENDNQEKD